MGGSIIPSSYHVLLEAPRDEAASEKQEIYKSVYKVEKERAGQKVEEETPFDKALKERARRLEQVLYYFSTRSRGSTRYASAHRREGDRFESRSNTAS